MQRQKNSLFPRISIVIPSFNKAKYIGITLDSIFTQKYENLEVIIQDGGSTDGTVNIIKSFTKKYPISWSSKKDDGQFDAIGAGLKKATGVILTYINADDLYVNDSFRKVSDAYIKNPGANWFAGRGIVIDGMGREIAKSVKVYKDLLLRLSSYNLLLSNNYLIQPSIFFTKDAYRKYGPFSGTKNFITEYEYWLKLGSVSMPVVINGDIAKFRIENSTKTKRMSKALLQEDWKIVKRFTNNPLILALHAANNAGRLLVNNFV